MLVQWVVHFGAGMLVALQGASVRVVFCFGAGAAAGCRCRCRCKVLLQGAAVKVMCALWSWRAGAVQGVAAKCCFRVLLLECHLVLWSWPARAAARCRFRVRASGTTVEGLSAS